jgi:hypothetical protein
MVIESLRFSFFLSIFSFRRRLTPVYHSAYGRAPRPLAKVAVAEPSSGTAAAPRREGECRREPEPEPGTRIWE